jgi:hypothetical protein
MTALHAERLPIGQSHQLHLRHCRLHGADDHGRLAGVLECMASENGKWIVARAVGNSVEDGVLGSSNRGRHA